MSLGPWPDKRWTQSWRKLWNTVFGFSHRVQKSDAGVGIGMLIGDRITLPKNKENGKKHFMSFDRNEIHIQAFVHFITGKLIPGHSSSSTFHNFQESIISN